MRAEMWCRDPYGLHEERWFTDGRPTDLVRDGDIESRDPPPDYPPPREVEMVPPRGEGGPDDLRRAGDVPPVTREDYAAAGMDGDAQSG